MAFKDTIRNRMRKFLQEPDKTTQDLPSRMGGPGGMMRHITKPYFDSLKAGVKRLVRYYEYKFLDKNLAEATATLNIYSDNIVSGAIAGEASYQVRIDENTPNIEKIQKVVSEMEKRTSIKDSIWDIARDTISLGDDWEELVLGEKNKKAGIWKLKPLPPEEMFADIDERGVWNNPQIPYIQKETAWAKGKVDFEWWRVVHFKVGRGVYGVDRSIFSNASRRIGRQLLWIDDSVVLARLSRAYQRFAFMVDTTGLGIDEKFEMADRFLERIKRTDIADRTSGRISPIDSQWLSDEDIVMPVEKDSPQDVKVLSGDINLGKIDDILYIQTKFFMALNMPKQYASKEEGVRAKATITQLDIQFARQVRRKQGSLKPGLRHTYKVEFWLNDIDPSAFKWDIVFPPLSTMDEMLKWEMEKVKAEIAEIYTVKIGALNSRWVFQEVLGFTKEQIKNYALVQPGEGGDEPINISPETMAMIRNSPYLRYALDNLKDLAAWKIKTQKDLEGTKPVGVEREEALSDHWEERE